MDPPISSPSRAEDIPTSSQGPVANQPEVPSGETSARKLPIRSLRDGLLGCPLEALQALAPENYLRRPGAGRTSPERFADIIVHHQIEVCKHILIFIKSLLFYEFSNSLIFLVSVCNEAIASIPRVPRASEESSSGNVRDAGQAEES
jgi:hypothetical protein